MALRSTFGQVIEMVRNEARLSTNSSRGIDHLDHIKQVIRRHYATLAEEYDWQHLNVVRDSASSRKVLQAGSRYYNFPADINPLAIERAWVKFGGVWEPLAYGIGYPQYSAFDPEADQRTDPVTHWDFHGDAQFEVWPLPASNGSAGGDGEVAFEGLKRIETLTTTSNRLDMDDHLVTLLAASEILTENGQKGAAEIKTGLANARLLGVRRRMNDKQPVRMGLGKVGESASYLPRHPRYIRA